MQTGAQNGNIFPFYFHKKTDWKAGSFVNYNY